MSSNDTWNIKTIALGDGLNDIPMLERVDYPVLVQTQNSIYDPQIAMPKLIRPDGIGPVRWNKAVLELLNR